MNTVIQPTFKSSEDLFKRTLKLFLPRYVQGDWPGMFLWYGRKADCSRWVGFHFSSVLALTVLEPKLFRGMN
jgi:hypothetical protein